MTSNAHAQTLLANAFATVVQRSIQDRRTYVEIQDAQRMRDGASHGFVELEGAGESIVDVTFPIRFAEPPIFTAGLELRGNAWLEWGSFPIWSATVAYWHTENVATSTLYVGATVGVVTFNAARSLLHYSFQGRSFTNPVDSSTSVSQVL